MLHIPESVYHQLRRHGEAAYPLESCGVLVGQAAPEESRVVQAIPVENTAGSARNRYQIAPIDLIRIQKQARADQLEILGFYHSHPDHPAKPSATDLAEAHWLGCSYLITEIRSGVAATTRSFSLSGASDDDKRFDVEDIHVESDVHPHKHL